MYFQIHEKEWLFPIRQQKTSFAKKEKKKEKKKKVEVIIDEQNRPCQIWNYDSFSTFVSQKMKKGKIRRQRWCEKEIRISSSIFFLISYSDFPSTVYLIRISILRSQKYFCYPKTFFLFLSPWCIICLCPSNNDYHIQRKSNGSGQKFRGQYFLTVNVETTSKAILKFKFHPI